MAILHEPACLGDVIGLDGFKIDKENIISFAVTGNYFSQYGIVQGSYLVCDKNAKYSPGDLLAINDKSLGSPRLVHNITADMDYIGKVIMAIRPFG